MFRTKKDVDRHVTDILSKIHNENEKSLRGYNFARLYFQVRDFEAAKKHLAAYVSIRAHHAPSHKLMAQIYEATHDIENALQSYKRSLEIDSKQKDIVLKICELYCSLPVDHETAKYWADRADQLFPHNDIVFRLRECLMTTEGEPNREELENLISAELAVQPYNLGLRLKLLKLYLDSGRVKEAYEHVVKVEKKMPFPTKTEWYNMLVEVFEAYEDEFGQELDFNFYVQFLTALDHLVFLTLAEPHALQLDNDRNSSPVVNSAAIVLKQFDHHLKKASEKDMNHGAWIYFFRYMKGQLYMHMGSLIFKFARKDQSKWKEACRFGAALFLVGYTFKPSNLLQEVWFLQMDEQQKMFTSFFHKGAMRTSFMGHVIISLCKDEEKSKWLQKIKQDVCLRQVRERIYNRLFSSANVKGNISKSYFLSDTSFIDSSLEFPSIPSLLEHDKSLYKMCPGSLHHLVWLHLHQKDMNVESFQSSLHESFKGLQFSNNNLSKGSPESLCMLDVEAYLLAVLYTTNLYLEQKAALNGRNGDCPMNVPPDIADPLCTSDQGAWWQSVHGLVNNTIKNRHSEHRRILQRGLEVIRGVGNHGLEIQLVVHLARAFSDKAAALSQDYEIGHIENDNKKVNVDRVSAFEFRAAHYWNIALSMLDKLGSNQTLRVPKDRMFNGYSKSLSVEEITSLNEEGKLYLACRLMNSGNLEEAVEVLEKLLSPYASYYLALTYKKLALQESTSSNTRTALLHKARDAFYTTMDRIKGDTTHTLNEDLYIEVEEIESEIGKQLNYANANASRESSDDADECDATKSSFRNTSKCVTPLKISQCLHSTPRPSPSFMTSKSKVDGNINRTHLEPSPERLDAQIRALALTQSTLIKTLVEQQRSLLDTNKAIIEELKQNKDVVVELKKQLEELHISSKKVRHRMPQKKLVPKGRGDDEDEDYTDYETNGYLDYYVDDALENYQQNSYNPTRVVNDGASASAMSYVPPAGLAAIPPPTIPHYGYQYPPPTHHGIAPPPPHGAIPEGSHYYPAALNHGLQFSEGQPLPQFRFHVAASSMLKPPMLSSIASIPQPSIPVVPPPGVSSLSQAHSTPSWAKQGTIPHAFQIPLPSSSVGSPLSQPPAVLSTPPFISSSPASQPSSSYISAPSALPSMPKSTTSDFYLRSLLSNSSPVTPPTSGQFTLVNSSTAVGTGTFSFANTGLSNHTPETSHGNRSRQDSDVFSDADIEREVMGDFKPVIPLPEEVVVQTGEEEETVLFENRAKLFRFVDREWKERGIGAVKILKHETMGRVRLLMRRDQVHKVCANHRILPTMEISSLKGSDKALTWAAQDFADETVKLEKFCIKFKTSDIAASFKKAFEDATKYAKLDEDKKKPTDVKSAVSSNSIAPSQQVTSLGFGTKGLPKVGSWTCPTCLVSNPGTRMSCIACETEKPGSVKNLELPSNNKSPFTMNSSRLVTTSTTNLCNFSGKPFIYQTPVISVNETLPPKENQSPTVVETSSSIISDNDAVSRTAQQTSAGIFGNFSFTSSDIVSESDNSVPSLQPNNSAITAELKTADAAIKEEIKNTKPKSQDNTASNSEPKSSGKPVSTFGGFTFSSTPVVAEKSEETKDREILVVTTKSKDGPQVSKIDAAKSPFTGFSFKSVSDFTNKSSMKNAISKPDQVSSKLENEGVCNEKYVFGSTSKVSDLNFSSLASNSSSIKKDNVNKSFDSGSPLFVTINKDGRRVSGEPNGDNVPEEFVPTADFQPAVPLPALVDVKTGEEGEEKLFGERVRLYRYDSEVKEWKERGVGELKLLYLKNAHKYRIVMRREQVLKICANHYILPEMKLSPLTSSDRTYVWVAQDFSEGDLRQEKFAAKFKNSTIAQEFYDIYEKCRLHLADAKNVDREQHDKDDFSKSDGLVNASDNQQHDETEVVSSTDTCLGNKSLFSDLFKPAPESWECPICCIRNEKNLDSCKACEAQRPVNLSMSVEDKSCSVKSSGPWECVFCLVQNSENKPSCKKCGIMRQDKSSNSVKPLSEMYKPDPSSWECEACFVRNDQTMTKCQACETLRPGTAPSTGSLFGQFSMKPSSGTFSSGFVFGSKDSLAKPTFQFGSFPNASSSTGFNPKLSTSGSDSAATVFGGKTVPLQPPVGSNTSVVPGITKSLPIPPVTAAPSFVFGDPPAVSSSVFSHSNSSQQPVVFPFGKSSPAKSGDEQSESADSVEFRFGSPQKYEFNFSGVRPRSPSKCPKSPRSPGTPTDADDDDDEVELSDVDNIYFQPVIPLPPKVDVKTGEEDETVLFNKRAKLFRFVDGEWKERGIGEVKILHNPTQNTVRLLMRRDQVLKVCLNHYVTKDMTFTWKGNKSLSWAAADFSENEPTPEQFAIRFKVAESALHFKDALDSALELSHPSDGIKTNLHPAEELASGPQCSGDAIRKRLDFSLDNTEVNKLGEESKNVEKSYAEKLSSFSFSLDKAKAETSSPPFSLASRFGASVSGMKSVMDSTSNFFVNPAAEQKDVLDSTAEQDTDVEVIYEAMPSAEQIALAKELMLPPTFFLYEDKPPCPGCRGCRDDDDDIPSASSNDIVETPLQLEPKTDATKTQLVPEHEEPKSVFSNTSLSVFSFADLAADNTGFEALAGSSSSLKAAFPGAGAPVFGNSVRSEGEDGDVVQGPDIHFEPVIPLPDIVEVKTGEEDEIPLYCNRARLYRYDTNTRQWKERGVGDLKILQHKDKCRFRVLLRRDQVHKVACNHVITSSMKINPMNTSETSVCWSAVDYSEGHPESSQFAAKFKNKEILQQFKSQFEACQHILSGESQNTAVSVTTDQSQTVPSTGDTTSVPKPIVIFPEQSHKQAGTASTPDEASHQHDESSGHAEDDEDEVEEEEEEDDDDDLFNESVSFEIYDETSQRFQHVGVGHLQVLYDDSVYGYRITVVDNSDITLCDHIIAIQTCLRIEGLVATWAAIDISVNPPRRRQFRATFYSEDPLSEFNKVFEEGKQIAVEAEIVEKSDAASMLHILGKTTDVSY